MGFRKEKLKFIQMEEEDDDELFFIIVPAILECLNDEKRPVHTSEYTGAKKVKEIVEGHGSWCKSELLTRTQCIVSSNHCKVYHFIPSWVLFPR
jgi:hypothetical protein